MSTFFKNTELADRYNISESTVRNWIKSAKQGKLGLELVAHAGRDHVASNISNISLIEKLVGQNRKYRNSLSAKAVTPSPKLFEVFNETQVYDIIRNLELHHEIPRQYGYFDRGVIGWDDYMNQQMAVDIPSMLRGTIGLLDDSLGYLDKRLAKFKKINVIDIGVGNAVPVKGLLTHLIGQGKLGRYVGLDFSEGMLELARGHLKEWFGDKVAFEGYQLDIARERFANLLAEDYLRPQRGTMNLVLFLGATPGNLRAPGDAFRSVCESMNSEDLLIYTDSLVSPQRRPEWFEHSYESEPKKPELLSRHRLVLELLNVKESFYDVELGFDAQANRRYARIRFKVAVTINFDLPDGNRTLVFEKGDVVTLWHCWQVTPTSLNQTLERAGFYTLHSTQSEDRNYILTIAEVQRD